MKKIYLVFVPFFILSMFNNVSSQNTPPGGSENRDNKYEAGWQLISSGVEENLLSVHFANPIHGFIGGALTRSLKSINGGINWSPVVVPSYADFDAVWAVSQYDAYLGGWDTIYATHNGGQSWQGAYTQTINYAIHDLHFISPDDGFAFMTWAQFAKTMNAGNSWSLAPGGGFTAWDFFGGFMLDQNTGYAVGDNQVLCKTTDGGENFLVYEWNGYLDFTGIRLWGVHATSELDAYAVADSGVVFRTTDGGNYWSRSKIAGDEDILTDIYFINASTGYIVGYNGKIFKTTDAGDNWVQEPQLTFNNLNSVFFISENLGWAVGDLGTILRYQGPNSVGQVNPPTPATYFNIFPNPASKESTLSFDLPGKQDVQIEIRDISGKVLKKIQDGSMHQGKNSILLSFPDLPNGVYECILLTDDKSVSKRFIIK